jgi:hypothetical protein
MLVSHRKKFIYTKTIKTGGTSVEAYFEKYCMPEGEWTFTHGRDEYISDWGIIGFRGSREEKLKKKPEWYNHMPASEIKTKIGDEKWREYYKFCVIRNPYEKVLSAFFHFVVRWSGLETERNQLILVFREWVRKGNYNVNDTFAFLINNEICIDYFIMYENLFEGIKHVCDAINVEYIEADIPKLKVGFKPPRTSLHDFYDLETAKHVEKKLHDIFKIFKYPLLF